MNKRFDDKPFSELNADHINLAKQMKKKSTLLRKINFHTKLLLLSQKHQLIKYLSLIICFIICITSNVIFTNVDSHISEFIRLVTIGLLFFIVWIVTSNDT